MNILGTEASKKDSAPRQCSSGRHRFCTTATMTPGEHHVVFFHQSE
jgi:hypothetical protein